MSRAAVAEPEVDMNRLQVAVHEVGHYLVWRDVPGGRAVSVQVKGRGTSTTGCVRFHFPRRDTPELVRGYLAGLLAGNEADKIFLDAFPRYRYDERGAGWDYELFARIRRLHKPSREIPERELRAEASRQLRTRWDHVLQLATQLAARGHLRV